MANLVQLTQRQVTLDSKILTPFEIFMLLEKSEILTGVDFKIRLKRSSEDLQKATDSYIEGRVSIAEKKNDKISLVIFVARMIIPTYSRSYASWYCPKQKELGCFLKYKNEAMNWSLSDVVSMKKFMQGQLLKKMMQDQSTQIQNIKKVPYKIKNILQRVNPDFLKAGIQQSQIETSSLISIVGGKYSSVLNPIGLTNVVNIEKINLKDISGVMNLIMRQNYGNNEELLLKTNAHFENIQKKFLDDKNFSNLSIAVISSNVDKENGFIDGFCYQDAEDKEKGVPGVASVFVIQRQDMRKKMGTIKIGFGKYDLVRREDWDKDLIVWKDDNQIEENDL